MAIDGVKIIDGDQVYDIYNEVVGRYRDGEHVTLSISLDCREKITIKPDFLQKFIRTASLAEDWSPDRRY